ncbi:XRE family transcriptional regulator [Enterococcus faecalis]|uniref:helix-turn-helix transcriptional regulator n=1 Tax=Enterococcus faecalis TaxID=1351 RepID=UPI0001B2E773|nr:helix-turn-helix transcriptional regulator [Enterococcus faecalis]EEU79968.1 cro/CI family transcriptional regulator [Enterococcus faecalis Fly1]EGO7617897.1 helix-turn-helix transcriptional regulator [Enterococcus faecalis]EGO7913051.1 helix-turn-helix transcriptional regulator [Enterococcus faecalis]EHZ2968493.1 helix-turn-helix transcriptional regulator [Enterococcus faecalis]EIB6795300.1 helix-turn-helix transcriptional regulator [Enterococcus faecalis]
MNEKENIPNSNIEFGNRIKVVRTDLNLTMDEFAKRIGVSGKSTVNEWEKGRSKPNKNAMKKISEISNVPLEWFYFGDPELYLFNLLNSAAKKDGKLRSTILEYLYQKTDLSIIEENVLADDQQTTPTQQKLLSDIIDEKISQVLNENISELHSKIKCKGIDLNEKQALIILATDYFYNLSNDRNTKYDKLETVLSKAIFSKDRKENKLIQTSLLDIFTSLYEEIDYLESEINELKNSSDKFDYWDD